MTTITIITAVYNARATIEACINSVITQSYPQIEYIVIDGQSTDGTVDIIQKYQASIAYWVSEKDGGMYEALNKGLHLACGEIIGFLNADDLLANQDVIADIVQMFDSQPVDSCYGDIVYVAPNDIRKIVRSWRVPDFHPEMFANGIFPPHPALYIKRDMYKRYGGFDCRFTIAADVELMLRFLVKHRISTAYLPKTLVRMRSGGKSNKNLRNTATGVFESYRGFARNDLPVSVLFIPKTLWFRLRQCRIQPN